jgi:hypothetical protein
MIDIVFADEISPETFFRVPNNQFPGNCLVLIFCVNSINEATFVVADV